MALPANTVWEVRTGGADTNGGAFVAGASGTDRSQQDAAFASGTNLTVDAATNTDVLPDGYTPAAADVGNVIQITTAGGGAAFAVGFYQVVSIQSGKWRLDRSPAATSSAGASWSLGGALATYAKALGGMASGNVIWVKAGAGYTLTATPTNTTVANGELLGYATTRGDGGRVSITLGTNSGLSALNHNINGAWRVANLDVNCNSLPTSSGFTAGGNGLTLYNCKISNFRSNGVSVFRQGVIWRCEITGGVSGATAAVNFTSEQNHVYECNIRDNACVGVRIGSVTSSVVGNRVVNNSGASSDGIQFAGNSTAACVVRGNTVYGSGRHGINLALAGNARLCLVRRNVLANNGGYGLSGTGLDAQPSLDGNAYYSNTSGPRNGVDGTLLAYTNVLDVTLTASPFVNAAGGDFSLNNAAGGGAAVRGLSAFGSLPGASEGGYPDLGCFQHLPQFPAVGNVRSGVTYDDGVYTGTLTLPTAAQVRSAVTFGAGGTEFTGTLALPAVTNVRTTITYGAGGTEFSGTLTLPAVGNVRLATTYGAGGTEFTGTLALPAAGNVRAAITYGSGGTEFTGTVTLPAASDVRLATTYGAGGTEFTGTLIVASGDAFTSSYVEPRPGYTGETNYAITFAIPGTGSIAGWTFAASVVKPDGTSAGPATAVVGDAANRRVVLTIPGQAAAGDYRWQVTRTDDSSNDVVAHGVIEVNDPLQ